MSNENFDTTVTVNNHSGYNRRPYTLTDADRVRDQLSKEHGSDRVRVSLTDNGHLYMEVKIRQVYPTGYKPPDEE
jgi:hypothetical protein